MLYIISSETFAACPAGTLAAAFTPSQVDICGTGATVVTFTNNSTGTAAAGADYEWWINGALWDNTTGLGAPTNQTISGGGTYNILLIGIDAGNCRDSITIPILQHPIPNADFTFAPSGGCANIPITFTNTSTGTDGYTTWWWDFGDGFTSTDQSPTHTYGVGGTYTVTLTQTNGPGCTDTYSTNVTVLDVPVMNITGDDGDGDLINCLLPADPTTQETVIFTNTSTGATSYTWDFGDGSPTVTVGTTASQSHTYTTYGTFTVTVTGTHANGCTSVATLTVVFEKYVSAALTLDITEYSGCDPHTLTTLVNLSVNANTYVWDFGDGSPPVTTTDPTPPNHTYTTGGTYTITLTASNSCNTAIATIAPIIIVDGPTADFNTNLPGNLGCSPQNTIFTNTSVNVQPANNYQWDMGNGNTYNNTTNPPNQTYTTGTYDVTLIAGNACGTDTIVQTITIDTIPIVGLIVDPDTGCTPLTVTSTNTSTGNPINFNWYVDGFWAGNGATLPDQVFTAPPGNTSVTHTIHLDAYNHCGTDDTTATILVHPDVVAIFTPLNPVICEGDSVTFTEASLGTNLTWEWDFGDGSPLDNTQGPHTHTYTTAGTYTVSLIVDGDCGPDTMTTDVTVNPIPIADITGPPVICAGTPAVFTNNSTAGGTYAWNFGAGATPATSTLFDPGPIDYTGSGTVMITLDVDVLGCTNADTVYVDIDPIPLPSFTLTPNDGCTPLDVTITNTSTINPGDTWAWDFGNGNTSTAQNPANEMFTTVLNDTVYNVQLIITSADGCIDSVTQTVTVHPLPVADFNIVPDTACANDIISYLNNSTGATTYAWDFGDGNTTTAISPTHSYTNQGTYTVELIAYTGFNCTDTVYHNVVIDSIPGADFTPTIECVGDSTQFTDISTGGAVSWAWNFGDGSPVDNSQNPVHLYAASGTYNVQLTVTNPAGCLHTTTIAVVVNDVPVANFTTNPTCLGSITQFTDATSGVPISWEWDFGDGSPLDNNQHPTHVYAATGTYDVTLVVGGGSGCSDTITLQVTVTPVPTSDFTFNAECINDTTFFVDASTGGPDTWYWDFGDGNTDATNNPNPDHVYTTAGNYNVMLVTSYSASGCTDTVWYAVDAWPRTVPSFTSNTPCLGGSTDFVDGTTNNPTIWTWDFGDGSPIDNSQNPSHVYATPGLFDVSLVTENTYGCIDSTQVTIQVYPLPVAEFSWDTVCSGFVSTFADLSTNAVAWEWDFDDGSPLDLNASPTHTFPSDGQYNVQLVVWNPDGCTDTVWHLVDVWPNPVADFTTNIACLTYPTDFTDNSTNAVQWTYDFGDGSPLSTQSNPSYTYLADGTYNVEQVVTNIYGCMDSITSTVTVLPIPQAGFTNNTVCAGATVQFNDTTTGTPNYWEWDFGDGSPVDLNQNPIHSYTLGGTYNITLIAGNSAGCYDTLATTIDVYTVPVPDFGYDTVCFLNVTNFTDLSTDAVPFATWDWDFGDGNTSGDQHPTYIYQNPGNYTVTLNVTNVNGCDSSVSHPVTVTQVPVAAFAWDTVCLGAPTTFTDLSTGPPNTWLWDFGDGNTSTAQHPVHTYASPGTYLVSLIVSGTGTGCTDQTFNIVTISNNAVAGINAPDSVCNGTQVTFDDVSTITNGTITSWFWDFGDGNTSTAEDTVYDYAVPGTYIVTHSVAASGGCVSSITDTVTVLPLPVAAFSTNIVCEGQITQFTDMTPGTIGTWNWDFGDGNTSTDQNPTHIYAAEGNYTVTLSVITPEGCSDVTTGNVLVNELPVAAFTNDIACWYDPTNFTDQSTINTGSIVAWGWDFGDGNTSNIQNPSHAFTVMNDSFYVTLVVASDKGCLDTVVQLVETYPVVDFDYGPVQASGCAPFEAEFIDNSTIPGGSNITTWFWDFDDGNFDFNQNPTHIYGDAGDYYVSLTVTSTDGCTFTDTLNYPITVFPQPIAGFTADKTSIPILDPEVEFTNTSSADAIAWDWDFGDFEGSLEEHPVHIYPDTGYYQVSMIAQNNYGCLDTAYLTLHVYGDYTFYVPNAFTPDGDGYNDIFYTQHYGLVEYEFFIFNRWGEIIFRSTDPNEGWDGTYKGVDVEVEVYVWMAKIRDINNEQHIERGHVTVIR